MKKMALPLAIMIFTGITILAGVGGSMFTIDEGERGVVLRNGKYSHVAEPGLNFKMPFIDRVVKIQVRTQTGKLSNIFTYSSDQQPANITLSITLTVAEDGVEALYAQFGSIENAFQRIVEPTVQREIKTVFGQFTALRSVQHREDLNNRVQEAITRALKPYPYLIVNSTQLENLDFSDAYEQTIEDRMKAEVEVERYRQNLEREKVEAQIAVTRAQAQADAQIKAAEAEAKAIALRSEAEASSIERKGQALRNNPNIVQLMQAERWNGQLPRTMVPNGAVPVLALPDDSEKLSANDRSQ